MDIDLFVKALGLAFVIEGLLWAAFPNQMRAVMEELIKKEVSRIQFFGLCGILFGLVLLFLANM